MKIGSTILIVGVVATMLFILLLYLTLRTKVTQVNHMPPYSHLIGETLVLHSDARLVRNIDAFVFQTPLLLLDAKEPLFDGVTLAYSLPAGTEIILESATLYKNGTSGFTTSIVAGRAITETGIHEFEHRWGDEHSSLDNNTPNQWTFDTPLWRSPKHNPEQRYTFKQ